MGNYGAVGHALIEPVLERAEFQAKKRVTYFLIVFIVTGLFSELATNKTYSGTSDEGPSEIGTTSLLVAAPR